MINCRPATIEDLTRIVAGNCAMAKETGGSIYREPRSMTGLELFYPTRTTEFIGSRKRAHVVGQILITYEWSDWRNAQIWWIQSVYVWPSARRQGVFKALLEYVASEATDASACELRLYADTSNTDAHATYLSQGFTTGHYQVFEKSLR